MSESWAPRRTAIRNDQDVKLRLAGVRLQLNTWHHDLAMLLAHSGRATRIGKTDLSVATERQALLEAVLAAKRRYLAEVAELPAALAGHSDFLRTQRSFEQLLARLA